MPGQDCLRRFDDAQLNFDDRSFPDPGLAAGAGRQSPPRQDQVAAGICDRARRARAECARNGIGNARHAVRGLDGSGQGLRGDAQADRPGGRHHDRDRAQPPGRRRVPRRRPLRIRGQPHSALRQHRKPTRQSAAAGGGERQIPEGRSSWLEVHRLWPRRKALRPGRGALQYLRARSRALRHHHAHESGRVGLRGLCARSALLRRVRLGSANQRAVVHGQWA